MSHRALGLQFDFLDLVRDALAGKVTPEEARTRTEEALDRHWATKDAADDRRANPGRYIEGSR
jgi:hypothetical protein